MSARWFWQSHDSKFHSITSPVEAYRSWHPLSANSRCGLCAFLKAQLPGPPALLMKWEERWQLRNVRVQARDPAVASMANRLPKALRAQCTEERKAPFVPAKGAKADR